MKCGHSAQGVRLNNDGTKTDGCLICDCFEEAVAPNLIGRTARCTYYKKNKPKRRYANDECNYGCKGKDTCNCGAVASNINLPFFKHKPSEEQDEFYCGCFGWD